MTDFIIPCDAFVRASVVLNDFHEDATEWTRSMRIDNGQLVASNHHIMTVENIGGNEGVTHIRPDAALVEQCRVGSQFNAVLHVIVNDMLKFTVAKTSLGYVHPGNAGVWSAEPNALDKWRSIVMKAAQPAEKSNGGMFWGAAVMTQLNVASPSGALVFEEHIDCNGRPTIVRDINDPDWFALFNPYLLGATHQPATLPRWMTA
jgi:hypothetical protein